MKLPTILVDIKIILAYLFSFSKKEWIDCCDYRKELKKDRLFDLVQLSISSLVFIIASYNLSSLFVHLLKLDYIGIAIHSLVLWVNFKWYIALKILLTKLIVYTATNYRLNNESEVTNETSNSSNSL